MSFLDTYNPADDWDRYCAREEERDSQAREGATCDGCCHCHVADTSMMKSHVTFMLNNMKLWQPKEYVQRSTESLLEEIAWFCEDARKCCAWCKYHDEFVNAEDGIEDCEGFERC